MPGRIDQESLLSSSQRWAQQALFEYTRPGRDDSDDRTLLFCAISWEHLCKAYLYSLDPALIFDPKTGSQFTISLRKAQSKIWQLRRPGPGIDRRRLLKALADVRDGVLHAAVLDIAEQRTLVVEYLASSEELYNEQPGEEVFTRWGEYSSLVSALISEPSNLVREQVEIKKLIAARRRKEIIGTGTSSSGDDYDNIVNELIVNRLNDIDLLFTRPERTVIQYYCPVCKEDDVAGYTGTIIQKRDKPGKDFLRVSEFVCAFCGLHLFSEPEMEIAGVGHIIDLEHYYKRRRADGDVTTAVTIT